MSGGGTDTWRRCAQRTSRWRRAEAGLGCCTGLGGDGASAPRVSILARNGSPASQRGVVVETRGPPGRQVAGESAGREQPHETGRQRSGVVGGDAVELAREQPHERRGGGETDPGARWRRATTRGPKVSPPAERPSGRAGRPGGPEAPRRPARRGRWRRSPPREWPDRRDRRRIAGRRGRGRSRPPPATPPPDRPR